MFTNEIRPDFCNLSNEALDQGTLDFGVFLSIIDIVTAMEKHGTEHSREAFLALGRDGLMEKGHSEG